MPTIDLCEFPGVGLIIQFASGVKYRNQTGGFACHQPVMEGVFAPLDFGLSLPLGELTHHFTGEKWKGSCSGGIDEETADFLNGVFRDHLGTRGLTVDRSRLAECEEAWIHVNIPREFQSEVWSGFDGLAGVVTWENSD